VAAARALGCQELYAEDMSHGRKVEGVTIIIHSDETMTPVVAADHWLDGGTPPELALICGAPSPAAI
jgi:hypothetical protein